MPSAETAPGNREFARLMVWAYRGELQGEAMFGALAGAWAAEGRGEKQRTQRSRSIAGSESRLPIATRLSTS